LSPERKALPGKTCGKTAGAATRALRKPAAETEHLDPDLGRILDAWPGLPEPIRAVMLAMVASACPCHKAP